MTNSDRMRIDWLEREGHHRQLVTVYGPFPCYSRVMIRAWVAATIIIVAVAWWLA